MLDLIASCEAIFLYFGGSVFVLSLLLWFIPHCFKLGVITMIIADVALAIAIACPRKMTVYLIEQNLDKYLPPVEQCAPLGIAAGVAFFAVCLLLYILIFVLPALRRSKQKGLKYDKNSPQAKFQSPSEGKSQDIGASFKASVPNHNAEAEDETPILDDVSDDDEPIFASESGSETTATRKFLKQKSRKRSRNINHLLNDDESDLKELQGNPLYAGVKPDHNENSSEVRLSPDNAQVESESESNLSQHNPLTGVGVTQADTALVHGSAVLADQALSQVNIPSGNANSEQVSLSDFITKLNKPEILSSKNNEDAAQDSDVVLNLTSVPKGASLGTASSHALMSDTSHGDSIDVEFMPGAKVGDVLSAIDDGNVPDSLLNTKSKLEVSADNAAYSFADMFNSARASQKKEQDNQAIFADVTNDIAHNQEQFAKQDQIKDTVASALDQPTASSDLEGIASSSSVVSIKGGLTVEEALDQLEQQESTEVAPTVEDIDVATSNISGEGMMTLSDLERIVELEESGASLDDTTEVTLNEDISSDVSLDASSDAETTLSDSTDSLVQGQESPYQDQAELLYHDLEQDYAQDHNEYNVKSLLDNDYAVSYEAIPSSGQSTPSSALSGTASAKHEDDAVSALEQTQTPDFADKVAEDMDSSLAVTKSTVPSDVSALGDKKTSASTSLKDTTLDVPSEYAPQDTGVLDTDFSSDSEKIESSSAPNDITAKKASYEALDSEATPLSEATPRDQVVITLDPDFDNPLAKARPYEPRAEQDIGQVKAENGELTEEQAKEQPLVQAQESQTPPLSKRATVAPKTTATSAYHGLYEPQFIQDAYAAQPTPSATDSARTGNKITTAPSILDSEHKVVAKSGSLIYPDFSFGYTANPDMHQPYQVTTGQIAYNARYTANLHEHSLSELLGQGQPSVSESLTSNLNEQYLDNVPSASTSGSAISSDLIQQKSQPQESQTQSSKTAQVQEQVKPTAQADKAVSQVEPSPDFDAETMVKAVQPTTFIEPSDLIAKPISTEQDVASASLETTAPVDKTELAASADGAKVEKAAKAAKVEKVEEKAQLPESSGSLSSVPVETVESTDSVDTVAAVDSTKALESLDSFDESQLDSTELIAPVEPVVQSIETSLPLEGKEALDSAKLPNAQTQEEPKVSVAQEAIKSTSLEHITAPAPEQSQLETKIQHTKLESTYTTLASSAALEVSTDDEDLADQIIPSIPVEPVLSVEVEGEHGVSEVEPQLTAVEPAIKVDSVLLDKLSPAPQDSASKTLDSKVSVAPTKDKVVTTTANTATTASVSAPATATAEQPQVSAQTKAQPQVKAQATKTRPVAVPTQSKPSKPQAQASTASVPVKSQATPAVKATAQDSTKVQASPSVKSAKTVQSVQPSKTPSQALQGAKVIKPEAMPAANAVKPVSGAQVKTKVPAPVQTPVPVQAKAQTQAKAPAQVQAQTIAPASVSPSTTTATAPQAQVTPVAKTRAQVSKTSAPKTQTAPVAKATQTAPATKSAPVTNSAQSATATLAPKAQSQHQTKVGQTTPVPVTPAPKVQKAPARTVATKSAQPAQKVPAHKAQVSPAMAHATPIKAQIGAKTLAQTTPAIAPAQAKSLTPQADQVAQSVQTAKTNAQPQATVKSQRPFPTTSGSGQSAVSAKPVQAQQVQQAQQAQVAKAQPALAQTKTQPQTKVSQSAQLAPKAQSAQTAKSVQTPVAPVKSPASVQAQKLAKSQAPQTAQVSQATKAPPASQAKPAQAKVGVEISQEALKAEGQELASHKSTAQTAQTAHSAQTAKPVQAPQAPKSTQTVKTAPEAKASLVAKAQPAPRAPVQVATPAKAPAPAQAQTPAKAQAQTHASKLGDSSKVAKSQGQQTQAKPQAKPSIQQVGAVTSQAPAQRQGQQPQVVATKRVGPGGQGQQQTKQTPLAQGSKSPQQAQTVAQTPKQGASSATLAHQAQGRDDNPTKSLAKGPRVKPALANAKAESQKASAVTQAHSAPVPPQVAPMAKSADNALAARTRTQLAAKKTFGKTAPSAKSNQAGQELGSESSQEIP